MSENYTPGLASVQAELVVVRERLASADLDRIRLRDGLRTALHGWQVTADLLEAECPNDLDEDEYPNLLAKIAELRKMVSE